MGWFKKKKEVLPQVGEKWYFSLSNSGDPFPSKEYRPSVILDVRDGWVRYSLNDIFNDERMSLETFLTMYRKE